MVLVREARPADADAIAAVRASSWRAAYTGIIPADRLDQLTSTESAARHAQALRERQPSGLLVAEAEPGDIVGFANFGPERAVQGEPPRAPKETAGTPAELYAIYVLPDYWSAGAGWALLTEVLGRARAARYATISLWVLAGNARARRFYERAGFALTPATQVLGSLGGVTEVRYELRL